MTLEPGSVFAGYTIERMLGAGGMGSVYLARHPRLPRHDALKVLTGAPAANFDYRRRFEREADFASRLRHPNIVSIYDRGVAEGQLWIAMEYVEGIDAAHLITGGRDSVEPMRAIEIIRDAAKGLDFAHRKGLLHRDVKPANILVTGDEDEGERSLIADFGIARSMDDSHRLTAEGDVLGTLAYAAPEQLEGRDVDSRVDVYALGCTLFELLTGSKPYPYPTMMAVMKAHLNAPPPRPTDTVRALPSGIDGVIAKALEKNPDRRYASCRELAEDAMQALTVPMRRPSLAKPSAPPEQTRSRHEVTQQRPLTDPTRITDRAQHSAPNHFSAPLQRIHGQGQHAAPAHQSSPNQRVPLRPMHAQSQPIQPYYPPLQHSPQQGVTSNGLALWSMISGIVGLVSCFTLIGGFALSLTAIGLGIAGQKKAKGGAGRSGMAIAGIALGVVTLILTIAFTIYVATTDTTTT
ncbi:protein kinase [Antrihabitans sp. YC3-6]|uniref:non-specific serine/threonine protein kinase n=1 Tax=Antrihabitans stalagmiti TaxID=2799499 RepID=A0A934NW06_9NOCA|nr:protein kinase [Antrihabitans stalagmiti]MBJ8342609.1 protein kinase [Antrihabitans stalagmiti]